MASEIAQSYSRFLKLNSLKILKKSLSFTYRYSFNFNILIITEIVTFSREIIVTESKIIIHDKTS
jgi:hypothetical protein